MYDQVSVYIVLLESVVGLYEGSRHVLHDAMDKGVARLATTLEIVDAIRPIANEEDKPDWRRFDYKPSETFIETAFEGPPDGRW